MKLQELPKEIEEIILEYKNAFEKACEKAKRSIEGYEERIEGFCANIQATRYMADVYMSETAVTSLCETMIHDSNKKILYWKKQIDRIKRNFELY